MTLVIQVYELFMVLDSLKFQNENGLDIIAFYRSI